jgi:hypothetical protein
MASMTGASPGWRRIFDMVISRLVFFLECLGIADT